MAQPIYKKAGHSARPVVLETDDGRFQGMVEIIPALDGKGRKEQICVPVKNTSYKEAFEEAKALAHKTLTRVGQM